MAGDAGACMRRSMGGSRVADDDDDDDGAEEQDSFEDAVDSGSGGGDGIEHVFRQLADEARNWTLAGELQRSNNKNITARNVEELRQWCHDSATLPDIDDPLLVAFLHSCRGDMDEDAVKSVMKVYESVRSRAPEVFADRSFHSEEVQRAKGIGYFCILPKKTPEGFRVIVQALRNPDPTVFVYSSSSKAQFLTMDALVRAEPTADGYVCLFDMKGVQLSHMWAWGIRLPRKIFQYLQEGLPLRMQRIHFVNTTPLMDRIMRMLGPFLRKELSAIFQFHTADDVGGLHQFIPRDCLPINYGGDLPPLEKLQGYTDQFLQEMDSLLLQH